MTGGPLRMTITAGQFKPGEAITVDAHVEGRGRYIARKLEIPAVTEAADHRLVSQVGAAMRELVRDLADAMAKPPPADEPGMLYEGATALVAEDPGDDYKALAGREVSIVWLESPASVHLDVPTLTLIFRGGTGPERWAPVERTDDNQGAPFLRCIVPASILRMRRGRRLVPVVLPPDELAE